MRLPAAVQAHCGSARAWGPAAPGAEGGRLRRLAMGGQRLEQGHEACFALREADVAREEQGEHLDGAVALEVGKLRVALLGVLLEIYQDLDGGHGCGFRVLASRQSFPAGGRVSGLPLRTAWRQAHLLEGVPERRRRERLLEPRLAALR